MTRSLVTPLLAAACFFAAHEASIARRASHVQGIGRNVVLAEGSAAVATPSISVARSSQTQDGELLDSAIAGSASCEKGPCWSTVMPHPAVQRLLLDMAAAPRSAAYADAALAPTGISRTDLERLGLVRRAAGAYVPSFPLFPARDVRLMRKVGDKYGRSLADAVLARRVEIDAALGGYPDAASRADVAFIVVGCFSLDWDGLQVAVERGYRRKPASRPDGRYDGWARERIAGWDAKSYWSSTSAWHSGFAVVAFGDGSPARTPAIGSVDEARVLFALREGPVTAGQLAIVLRRPGGDIDALLAALSRRGCVVSSESRFGRAMLVLSSADRPMVQRLRAIGRETLENWLSANYVKVKADLADIAPNQWGVPFAETFTAVWHEVFGRANGLLVEAGLFGNVEDSSRRERGHVAAVFDPAVLKER